MCSDLYYEQNPCGSILARAASSKQPLHFTLLALPKKTNKQTTKHIELWQEHCNSCDQLQRAPILINLIILIVFLCEVRP